MIIKYSTWEIDISDNQIHLVNNKDEVVDSLDIDSLVELYLADVNKIKGGTLEYIQE